MFSGLRPVLVTGVTRVSRRLGSIFRVVDRMDSEQNLRGDKRATGAPAHPQSRAIRNGILVAGGLALLYFYLLAKSPLIPEQRAKGLHPYANSAPFLLFLLIPFLTALVLIGRSTRRDLADSGTGVSLALFGAVLLGAPGSIMMVLTWAGLSGDAYLRAGLAVLIAFFADAAWVVWCSLRVPKKSSAQFLTAACLTLAYLGVGFPAITLHEFRTGQQQERQRAAQTVSSWQKRDAARSAVQLLTACLIQYRESQPSGEFPPSLSNLPTDLKLPGGKPCDAALAKPGVLSDYTITYTPEPDASDKITDFRLLAMPGKKGLDYVNPMLSDSRGRIWVYERWFAIEQGEHLTPQLNEQPDDWTASHILALSSSIRFEMKNKAMERPPLSLSELQLNTSAQEAGSSPDTLNESPYTVQYFPPRPGFSEGFALSAACQNYGDKCIRSFFLDKGGDIHQSTAPRPATADDPLIPDCEKYVQGCRDIDWPVP